MTLEVEIASYNPQTDSYNTSMPETDMIPFDIAHMTDHPAELNITFSDPKGHIVQRFTNQALQPVAGAVADDGGVETDETAEANSAPGGDMNLLPAAYQANDAYYFGFLTPTYNCLTLKIYTSSNLVDKIHRWEYSQGGDVWGTLADIEDECSTTAAFNVVGTNTVQWTVPKDWAQDSVGGITAYWVRLRVRINGAGVAPLGSQAWGGAIYTGNGRIKVTDTDLIFDGRILRAEWDSDTRKTTLYCEDWLSQLADKQIDYDMREDLDGAGLRESTLRADVDGAFIGAAENDAGSYYLYDDGEYDDDGGMGWANDDFNGKFFVISDKIAGKKTWSFHPYVGVTTDKDNTLTGSIENLWLHDGMVMDSSDDTPADFDTTFTFRCEVGHNTPSDFYVHDSITSLKVLCRMQVGDSTNSGICTVKVKGPVTDHTLAVVSYTPDFVDHEWQMDVDDLDDSVDADGTLEIKFDCDEGGGGGSLTLGVAYLEVQITCSTTGYSTATAITDTFAPNKLETATDFTAAATQLWEGVPYAIAKEIYLHIESATGPILGYDDMVTLTCAGGDVENTSGVSTRQYIGQPALAIAQDLALQDNAHLWIPLGTTTVKWESTQGADTVQLTDGDYNTIQIMADATKLYNKATAYGMRVDDRRLESSYTDSTSEDTYNTTRSKIVNDTGMVSEYDTLARATAIVNRNKDIKKMLVIGIRGNTALTAHAKTLKLMDVVAITSSVLGLDDVDYIVQKFHYTSEDNMTTLTLHPKVSTIGLQELSTPSYNATVSRMKRGNADTYIPPPASDTV